jgi:single-stranded DNA-binding protein
LALFCGENLKRGDWIFVEGRVQVRTYDSPEGKKKKANENWWLQELAFVVSRE